MFAKSTTDHMQCSLHAVILFLMSTIESVVIVSLERFACVKLTSPTYGETDQLVFGM